MLDCDHAGHRVYARRVFKNGSVHFCVQCRECFRVVKMAQHGYRPWIKANEVPDGRMICPFIEPDSPEAAQMRIDRADALEGTI